jgi:hypothetical protein
VDGLCCGEWLGLVVLPVVVGHFAQVVLLHDLSEESGTSDSAMFSANNFSSMLIRLDRSPISSS